MLTEQDKIDIWAEFMRDMSRRREPSTKTKVAVRGDIDTLVASLEGWLSVVMRASAIKDYTPVQVRRIVINALEKM